MGPSWGPLEGGLKRRCQKDAICNRLGCDLGRPGTVLGPSWGVLGPSRGCLGRIFGPPRPPLGVSWSRLGPCWGPLGIILGILSRQKRLRQNIKKPQYVLHFWAPGIPKRGPSWGQVRLQRAPKTILATCRTTLKPQWPPRSDLGANLRPFEGPRRGSRDPARRAREFGGGLPGPSRAGK